MKNLREIKELAENNYFTGNPGDGTYFTFDDSVDWMIAEIERLQETLEFYANQRNYIRDSLGESTIDIDDGHRAFIALGVVR